MMEIPMYQVDAFTQHLFAGNPAAVCLLPAWMEDRLLQLIAAENNLSETAFTVVDASPRRIRWFTPTTEVTLCGHATLATAHILTKHLGIDQNPLHFESAGGKLTVFTQQHDEYLLHFPTDRLDERPADHPVSTFFDQKPQAIFKGRSDYLLIFDRQEIIESIKVDFGRLAGFSGRGVIVTAPGDTVDFVSRCFYPQSGIDEDPATGSAHTTLAPYWSDVLGKTHLKARQLSRRGGAFDCILEGDRTLIKGGAVTFFQGKIYIPGHFKDKS